MTANDLRRSFLDYFARQGHRIVPSSPLVPADDPTLLFTNAGMNQFKNVFLGRERRDYTRAASAQKVMRVSGKHNDLDNVGPSLRHHTFFEMLGNFSFGDYFKKDAIPYAWELLTREWGLPDTRLFPTVFRGDAGVARDDEAARIWAALVPASRITELGLEENFWQMGDTGPCGRCSEIHYFRGNDVPCPEPVCRGLECSCDRYIEIWNNVFMEFERQEDGTLRPLPAPSIDTGMGFERITSVMQGKIATYDTDLFMPILDAIGARAGRRYERTTDVADHPDVSMRVIADHLRAMTFLIADGVLPSNEWRGYVLRKIMRRAMRHGRKLGFTEPVLHALVDVVVHEMGDAYPELRREHDTIVRVVRAEEERFDAVLSGGLPRIDELLDRTEASGTRMVPGLEVFRLYDSLGVPLDFVEDMAGQRGLAVDRPTYDEAMNAQRERARAGSAFEAKKAARFTYEDEAERARLESLADGFEGYETTTLEARAIGLFDAGRRQVDRLNANEDGFVVLDRTPFYVEAGGQVSDRGRLLAGTGTVAHVVGMGRLTPAGVRMHQVRTSGALAVGDRVRAEVDQAARDATRRNHTATHLLHAALRSRLGTHVRQAGSLVAPDRLRFDFTHGQALTGEDRRALERVINEQVFLNRPVQTDIRSTEDAIKAGAMALFGEKYGETVRVVTIPGVSVELCGGTHVRATGDIGPFVITGETSVGAGVRRIEALTGSGAVEHLQQRLAILDRTTETLGVSESDAPATAARLQAEVKRLARENAQLRLTAAMGGGGADAQEDVVAVGDARFVARRVSGLERDALRSLSDSLRDRLKRGVVVLAGEQEGKVQLLVSVTSDLTDRLKAGQLVKQLAPMIGGAGGGRPEFAEAGGRDASTIDDLLVKARELVTAALGN
jgi:alanyl-tRNA synthetase